MFDTFIPMAPEKKFDVKSQSFFNTYAVGANTARDSWTYNFSSSYLTKNMKNMIDFYNSERLRISELRNQNLLKDFDKEISSDSKQISWSVNLKNDLEKLNEHSFDKTHIITSSYRPFCKQKLYFHKPFIERPGLNDTFFPTGFVSNQIICVSPSPNDNIAVLITDSLANLHYNGDSQCFPLYYFEERKKSSPTLFDAAGDDSTGSAYEYVVNGKSAIEWIMERYQITTHKDSGIKNDPNDWAEEVGNPRYILDLLLSIINVSVQTVDIVNGLPKLEFETNTESVTEILLYSDNDSLSLSAEPENK